MSMLKDLIETAAGGSTSAGAVAGFRNHFFAGDMKGKKKKKKKGMMRRAPQGTMYGFRMVGEGYNFTDFLKEAEDSDFDQSDVIAKLKSAAKDAEMKGEDTVAFALEDENGAMVKVWVPQDQADDFQSALEMALSKNDADDDEQNNTVEIAEVLWKLRKDFDIVNVEWAEIPEDQEEALPADVDVEGDVDVDAEAEVGIEGDMEGDDDEMEQMTADDAEGEDLGDTGEEDAKTALQSVIDMMKADADARKAEAEAKQKEAEADIAKYNKQAAADKVKQEEEILDMEAYYDKQKEEKGEADRLAKLAKYRHDMASDAEASIDSGAVVDKEMTVAKSPEGDVAVDKEVSVASPEDEEYARHVRHARGDTYDTMMSKAELGDLVLRALRRR